VIHVGETFTAYLGALNVSKTLHVTRLTVTAQLQTPSQRWVSDAFVCDICFVGAVDLSIPFPSSVSKAPGIES
jgi:hypothetical protein